MPPSVEARASETFRPDIEGLRGVAVLLVLLFHAGIVGLPGGFIGVDVFFVISGFLITGLLIREREQRGGIRMGAFYARRVRRLLPAGMVVLALTMAASFVLLNPLDRPTAALDAAAAALSIGNIRFALAAGDYFASVESPSPFLHFWSLAVEEQFYLVWPALVLLAARGHRPRLTAGLALGAVLAVSLAANLVVTDEAPSWAFYSLPTRAWQLALGGLLAVGGSLILRVMPAVLAGAGWVGLAALGVASIALDSDVAYPGPWALVPTFAAAGLIVSGMTRHGPGALLAVRPLRFLGRISYSLYLWHWPILVLPAAALDADLPLAGRIGLAGLAILLAWLSWRFIEEPFRVGLPSLTRHPLRTVFAGGVAVALVVSSAGGLAAAESSRRWSAADAIAALENLLAAPGRDSMPAAALEIPLITIEDPDLPTWTREDARPTPTDAAALLPAAAASPPAATEAPPVAASPDPIASPTPQTYVRLPSDVRPALALARTDEERLRRDGCLAIEATTSPRTCIYGNASATFTVALVGDSHAAQWFPALERVALERDWRILVLVKVACPFLDMPVTNISLKREYRECTTFNKATIARLGEVQPDLTLVSMSRFAIHPVLSKDGTIAAQAAAFARLLAQLPGRVAVIVDTPDGGRDIPACLASHVSDVRACNIAWSVASARSLGEIERAATAATGDALIDLTPRVCRAAPGDACPVVVDGMIVFRDLRHLTATFSASMAPDLDRALASTLDQR